MQEQKYCACPPEECDTFQFMSKKLGMKVLHPGGLQATKSLAEKCRITKDMTILDAGCGQGSSSIFLAKHYGCRVVGVDVDPMVLMKAHEKAQSQKVLDRIAFRLADVETLPLTDGMFDGAIFQASLIFCDKTHALNSVVQKIRKGGFLGAIELAWKAPPPMHIKSRVNTVLCAAVVNAEQHTDWVKLFEQSGLVVETSEMRDMGFGFANMISNEGLLSAARIALKCSFNSAARKKIASVTKLFKETDAYLGYGIYACRKPDS